MNCRCYIRPHTSTPTRNGLSVSSATAPPPSSQSRWCHSWLARTYSTLIALSPSLPSSFPPLPSWPRLLWNTVRQGTDGRDGGRGCPRCTSARTHTWMKKTERGASRFGLSASQPPPAAGVRAGVVRVTDLALAAALSLSLSLSLCVLQGCTLQQLPLRRSLQRPPLSLRARPPARAWSRDERERERERETETEEELERQTVRQTRNGDREKGSRGNRE